VSFILEALKKSEEERRKGKVPGLDSAHGPIGKRASGRSVWMMVLAIALLLNACLFLWWVRPWRTSEEAPVALAEKESISPAVESGQVQASSSTADPTSIALPVDRPGTTSARPKGDPSRDRAKKERPESEKKFRPATVPAAVPRKIPEPVPLTEPVRSAPPAVSREKVTEDRIYRLEELPDQLRRDLPELQIALHYYTEEPSFRLVRVNTRNLREGDKLSADLVLEEIAPSRIIFRFRGTRFQIGDF